MKTVPTKLNVTASKWLAVGALALSQGTTALADKPIIDCPLRDAPYSVDTPLMDVMLNPAAASLLKTEAPELMQRIPPMFLSPEAPSLSSIMTLRGATALLRMPAPEGELSRLDAKLATVALTDQDKSARCARYDNERPDLALSGENTRILVFDKFNGYGHGEATLAATEAIQAIAKKRGWGVAVTNSGGAFNPATLGQFDAVVWNNVSGDVLTLSQRQAFEDYIEQGGGFLGIHGSGGDFIYLWDWYLKELLGTQFIGHTMDPHYQDARVTVEDAPNGIGADLDRQWVLHDEWYSFAQNPREGGASVVATVDEASYTPEMSGISLRMGADHPIAWTRCVGSGRAFYTAIGHLPEVYQVEQNLALLENALSWAAGLGAGNCDRK